MYSVFISYRRDGGEAVAQLVNDRLRSLGFQVFYDIESLHSGAFDKAIYSHIDACDCFVLILSPMALDRCVNEEDWVRKEILYAYEQGKRIIPLFTRGFLFPALPIELAWLPYQNGVQLDSMMYLDSAIEKLISYFEDEENKPGAIRSSQQVCMTGETDDSKNIDAQLDEKNEELFSQMEDENADLNLSQKIKIKLWQQYIDELTNTTERAITSDATGVIPIVSNSFVLKNVKGGATSVYYVNVTRFDVESKELKPNYTVLELEALPDTENDQNKYSFGEIINLNHLNQCAIENTRLKRISENEWTYEYKKPLDFGYGQHGKLIFCYVDNAKNKCYIGEGIITRKIAKGDVLLCIQMCNSSCIVLNLGRKKIDENNPFIENSIQTRKYEASEDGRTLLIDAETGKIVRRYVEYDERNKKRVFCDLMPYKTYISLAFRLNVSWDNDECIRPMTDYEIGKCMAEGTCGFTKDIYAAIEYFEMDGSADAIFELSQFLLNDTEFRDEELAYEYLQKAAEMKCQKAMFYYSRLIRNKTESAKQQDELLGAHKICKALSESANNDYLAEYALLCLHIGETYYYAQKESEAVNYDQEAVRLFEKCAETEPLCYALYVAKACNALGWDYLRLKKIDDAIECANAALKHNGNKHHLVSGEIKWTKQTIHEQECKINRLLVYAFREKHQRRNAVDRGEYLLALDKRLISEADIPKYRKWFIYDALDLAWDHFVGREDASAKWWMKSVLQEAEHLHSLDPQNYIKVLTEAYETYKEMAEKWGEQENVELMKNKLSCLSTKNSESKGDV